MSQKKAGDEEIVYAWSYVPRSANGVDKGSRSKLVECEHVELKLEMVLAQERHAQLTR